MKSIESYVPSRLRSRGIPARIGSLAMLLQRSPLLKLLPEARVISSSGFTDAVQWVVMTVAGLGAFDAVSGATLVSQVSPTSGSATVSATGGANLSFVFTIVGAGGHTPYSFQIVGTLPAGLVQTGLKNSKTDAITGVPTQTGSFPITIIAWENSGNSGRSTQGSFTITVANPPAPTITVSPTGGNFQPGAFISLQATHTSGFSFIWKKDGTTLPASTTTLISTSEPRKYNVPTADPGTTWRSGAAFVETGWTAVSGGIGYDTNTAAVNYLPFIAAGGNVQSLMSGLRTSANVRIPFTMKGSTPLSALTLKVQCDDGFVAWLNGTQVAALNKPTTLAWNSAASGTNADATAITWASYNLNGYTHLLRSGENLLAVQMLNESTSSSDLLFNCELIGSMDAANSRVLVIPAVQAANAGSYTVTAVNPTGSATSNAAKVVLPPAFQTQPDSTTIPGGTSTTLTAVAVTSPPWTWQWYQGESGDTANPVAGATAPSFTTPTLTVTQKYWVRVTNPAGSADSATATVTVLALPPSVTGQPQPVEIDAGATAQLTVTATGDGTLTYQWYRGPAGNTSDPISGATSATLTTAALTQNETYWVRVTNNTGSADSNAATVTVRPPFDSWRKAQFSAAEIENAAISGPAADPDGDGASNEREYILGSSPKNPEPDLVPAIAFNGQTLTLHFTAAKASGPGYAGRTRHYTVETTDDPSVVTWTPLAGGTDITGDDQQVSLTLDAAGPHRYARLRVWLTP